MRRTKIVRSAFASFTVRSALQNAASIAGLMLTTEALISEVPQEDAKMPAMPDGGMGGGF